MFLKSKDFADLTLDELYQIFHLRLKVFVEEQQIMYTDTDFIDQHAKHYFIIDEDKIVSYLRFIPPGILDDFHHIGRVATHQTHRHQGLATQLIKQVIEDYPDVTIIVSAQSYLKGYYEELGFKMIAGPYLEAGILHYKMKH